MDPAAMPATEKPADSAPATVQPAPVKGPATSTEQIAQGPLSNEEWVEEEDEMPQGNLAVPAEDPAKAPVNTAAPTHEPYRGETHLLDMDGTVREIIHNEHDGKEIIVPVIYNDAGERVQPAVIGADGARFPSDEVGERIYYSYDSNGTLRQETHINFYGQKEVFFYDADGLLIQHDRYGATGEAQAYISFREIYYYVNGQRQVRERQFFDSEGRLLIVMRYDINGNPIPVGFDAP